MGFYGRVAPVLRSVPAWGILTVLLIPVALRAEGPGPPMTAEAIVQKMMAANARRGQELRSLTGKRFYHVAYHGFPGGRDAEMQVEATYIAPDKKDFKIISQSGSKILINHVFLKLLDSEKEYLQEANRRASELSPANYEFSLVGEEHTADGDCWVLAVNPREKTKFLYKGKIWVDTRDFAVARIQGEPAKNPSLWISRTEIDHHYQKIGDFWLPEHNQSITQVRLGGRAVLTIDYSDYRLTTTNQASTGHPQGNEPVLPPPTTVTADPH
jgi:hypothetical protein